MKPGCNQFRCRSLCLGQYHKVGNNIYLCSVQIIRADIHSKFFKLKSKLFTPDTKSSSSSIWLNGNISETQVLQYQVDMWIWIWIWSSGSRLIHFIWHLELHIWQSMCLAWNKIRLLQTEQLSMTVTQDESSTTRYSDNTSNAWE